VKFAATMGMSGTVLTVWLRRGSALRVPLKHVKSASRTTTVPGQ